VPPRGREDPQSDTPERCRDNIRLAIGDPNAELDITTEAAMGARSPPAKAATSPGAATPMRANISSIRSFAFFLFMGSSASIC
jgi:hypothetical protein